MRKLWVSLLSLVLIGALVLQLSGGWSPKVGALSSDEIQEKIDALNRENQSIQQHIDELEQQKQDNYTEMEQVVAQKNTIDQQIALLYAQQRVLNEQIIAHNALIADKQTEVDAAQQRFQELSDKNKARIRAMEEDGGLSYWSVLFKASSFFDLLDRLNMVQEIAASDRRRMAELKAAADAVAAARDELITQKAGLEESLAQLAQSEQELTENRAQSEALLADLVARGEEFTNSIEEGESRLEELLDELAQQEKAYNEALYQEWLLAHPPTDPPTDPPTEPPTEPVETNDPTKPTEPTETTQPEEPTEPTKPNDPPSESSWLVPCSYVYVSSPFSDGRLHPILGYVRPHNGVDLAANQGTPIYATRSGKVTLAQWDSECGNFVMINHGDGFSSIYMHMTHYVVSAGEYVQQGQLIGYVGSTGLSTGPHLHFGISYNGTYVNPANYIDI